MKRISLIHIVMLIIAAAIINCDYTSDLRAAEPRWLTSEQIMLYGLGLRVEPEHQTVPKDIATIVSTYLQAPDVPGGIFPVPDDVQVKATLRGPSLSGPIELTTEVNGYFDIPPLQRAGLHTLENIRVVSGGEVLFYGTPESVTIDVIDKLLVTEITARPLTADEIRENGIVFDQDNFQAYNFSAAFAVSPGEEININFPVVIAKPQSVSDVTVPVVQTPQLAEGTLKQVSTIIPDTMTIAQTTIPNLTVRGFTLTFDKIVPEGLTIPPIPGVIVIPGDIGFLNQYFSVMLMVGNVAPEGSGLVVENLFAEISLPAGNDTVVGSGDDPLRMAVTAQGEYPRIQNISQPGPDGNLGTADDENYIGPGDTGNAEFLVEGCREGSHTIEMEITGTLTGLPIGPVAIRGRAAGAVLVRNPNFTLTFTHPDVVNDGEEYDLDITVTNTSESIANFVSINLYERNISGATLIGEPTREFDTILPGDSESVSFRLRSKVTGSVYAATLDSDENVAGRFELKTSVGELGIPLSPDSLVLPKEAGALPADLRKASIGLLGKAYATATAPASALPADVKRFTKKMVWNRAVEVAEAGLRLSLHEPLADTAAQLLMDFMGSNYTRLEEEYPDADQAGQLAAAQKDFDGFDDLRRRSFRGDVFAGAVASILSDDLAGLGAVSFHQGFAEKVSYRPQHISVLISADSSALPFFLTLIDDQGNVLGGCEQDSDKIVKQIPYSDFLEFEDAQGDISSQMAIVSVPQGTGYTIRLNRNQDVPADTPFTLSVVLPADTESGLRHAVFSGITGEGLPVVERSPGDPYELNVELYEEDGQQISAPSLYSSLEQEITDPAPSVLGVVQQAEADLVGCGGTGGYQLGRVVAVLFSEEVTASSVQDQFDRIDITNYAPEENAVVAVALQPGARIVFIALRDSLGPFIEKQITISNIIDLRGHIMDAWTGVMEPTITEEGAVISGQVLNADGTPVENAEMRLYFWNGDCGWYGVSAKNADAEGRYAWDFVLKNTKGKVVAIDPGTSEFRPVEFKAGRDGQRLNVNIVLLGRGTVSGRVLAEDGFTLLEGAQIKVTSLTDYSQYGATSDEQGYFLIPDVPVGSILIESVHVESNSSRTLSEYISVAKEVLEIDLVLVTQQTQQITVEYGTLSGYVLEADGTAGVAGVPVTVYYRSGSQEGVACPSCGPPNYDCAVAFATTDDNGAFSFEDIPAGEIRVYTFEQARYIEGEARIQLLPDVDEQVNILLSGGIGTVSGIVLDADGNPVAGAQVGGGMSLTTTDEEGRFTLSDVPVGERDIVAVSQAVGSQGNATINLVAEGEEVYATVVLAGLAGVTGTVYEPDGSSPVAGMNLYLWYQLPNFTIRVVGTSTTDADGHYLIENVALRDDYFLSAFLPDMSKGNIEPVELNFNGQVKRTDITCIGQGSIEGVVLDDDGQTPLEAQVSLSELRLVRAGPVGVRFQYIQHSRVVENNFTTGEFSFDNVYVGPITVATGGAFNLMCRTVDVGGLPSDVLDPITYTGIMPHDGAVVDVTLQLQATSQIRGTVYESDGVTPVGEGVQVTFRGFRVVCYPSGVCIEQPLGIQEETVVTDLNGQYWLPVVTPWKFELVASDMTTGKIGKVWGTTMPGQTADVPIRLLGLGEVTVNVFASDGHTPIPNALVDLEHAFIFDETLSLRENFGFSTIERHGSADAYGSITFSGGDAIPEGEFVVVARDPSNGFAGRASGKVTVDGEQVAINVYLYDATGSVSGIVYEPDGITPAVNAEVIISRMIDGYDLGFFVTDENGAYTFDIIPLGDFEITVFEPATGRRGFETGSIDYSGQETVVVIVERPIGFITGTVMRTGDLSPLSGWDLELIQLNDRGEAITWRATSGPGGSFMFSGITLGTFELFAQQGENSVMIESRITYEGETVDIPVVVNLVQDPVGTIEGVVYNPDGSAAANAEVCLDKCPPLGRGTTTDEYGAFSFTDVPLGRQDIRVSSQVSDDFGTALVDVDFAGRTAFTTIVLDGLGTISGIVEDQSGAAVPWAQVNLFLGAPTPERTVYADENGEFSFIQLSSRRYTIVASHPITGLSGSNSVVLALGQDEQTRVVLEPTFSITGIVVSSGSVPVRGVFVTLEHLDHADPNNQTAHMWLYAETDTDGSFTFGAVPLGQCVITFEDPIGIGHAERTRTVLDSIDLGTIVLDDAVPAVLSADPSSGAVNVPMDQILSIMFTEQINPGTINLDSVTLTRDDGQQVDGYLTVTDGDTVVTFTPLADLTDETRYTLRLSANPPFASLDTNSSGSISRVEAARFFAVLVHFDEYDINMSGALSEDEYPGGIEDRFGHVMAQDYMVPFTTEDITAPSVADASPAPSTGGVSVDSVVRVTFSEPVDPTAFAGQAIVLSYDMTAVDGRFDMILGNTGMVFTPTLALTEDTTYHVSVLAATDLSGNVQAQGLEYDFTTTDRTDPVIAAITLSEGGTVIEGGTGTASVDVGASYDVAFVDFYINSVLIYTDRQADFEMSFEALSGYGSPGDTITVSAVATDTSGNRGDALESTFTIIADAVPTVTISSIDPSTQAQTGQRVELTVEASDDLGLTAIAYQASGGQFPAFSTFDVDPAATSSQADFAFYVPTDAVPGSTITVNASALDTRGQAGQASSAQITVLDATNPVVHFAGLTTGERVEPGEVITAVVEATDIGGIASVTFEASGATVYSDIRMISPAKASVASTFTFTVSQAASPTQNITLEAIAVDAAGNSSTRAQVVLPIADLIPPVVSLDTATGLYEAAPGQTIALVADAGDEMGVERVELSASGAITYFDAQQISPSASDTQAVFSVTIPETAKVGDTITFEATAYDTSGNVSQVSILTITIQAVFDITMPSSIIMIAGEHQDISFELRAPAPAGGVLITFASEDSTTAVVQPSVTIPEGQTVGTFELSPIRGDTTIINASIQGALRASMTVTVRGGVVTGTVLDQDLNPVSGADLTINGIVLTSEPDGTFFVEGVPGIDVVIRAFDPDTQFRGYLEGTMNVAGGYLRGVVVVLIPAGTITGTVYLPDLQTLAGPGVRVDLIERYAADPVQTVFTDEESRFEFPLVAIGDYRVEASDISGNRGRTDVAINASGEERDITVAFLGRGNVTVSVIDGSGTAVPNAALTFRGYSIFGNDYRVETASLDGTFEFMDVFVGEFSITALEPLGMGARASGTIQADGEEIALTMQTGQWASIEGTVYRADGTTPAAWAELITTGHARTTADENGWYRFDILPLGTYSVKATDEATRGIGYNEVTLDTNGETATLDIELLGQGTMIVTVEDYTGSLVSGADIELWEKIEDVSFRRLYHAISNENGIAVIDHVLEGQFRIIAKSDIYSSQWTYDEIFADEVIELTLTLEPTATIAGTVYEPDNVTPVENVKVQVSDRSTGIREEYITGADGTYVFENRPLGTYLLEAYEGGTIDAFSRYIGGQLRARIRDIPVDTPSEVVTVDVTLVGLGTVSGQIFMPGGNATAPDMPVTLRSLTPDYGKTWSLDTDGAGFYMVERVPVGDFIVSSGDIDQGVYGEEQGSIAYDGETVEVGIIMQNNAITLPQTLSDGNVVPFDLQADGTIEYGRNGLFSQYPYSTVKGKGGGVLEIVSDSILYPFDGGEVPTQEGMGREIVVRQNDLAGLNVTRKVYVPQDGYFARYLEIVSNPTDQPVTADIVVTSNLNYTLSEFHIIATSTGDDAIQFQGVDTPDTWVVIDDNNINDPFLVTSYNRPPLALVWAGADAGVGPDSVEFIQRTGIYDPARVIAQWSQVTLNPGETRAYMHCIVQQLSQEAAQASAERLAALPPELLSGMSLTEMEMVQNFAMPSDGSSALIALPALTGTVSGQVLACDGFTPPSYGDVLIKSDNIFFGRTYIAHPDTTGYFLYESDQFDIPLQGFTISARVYQGTDVVSPEVTGMLSNEQPEADVDIVFSNTGIIEGTVRRATTETPVSGADVSIDMSPYSVDVETAQNGSYRAAFLAPGTYSIEVAAEGIPDQGYPIRAESSGTVDEGQITTVDITLPPLGTISGVVTGPDESPMSNVRVVLSNTVGDDFTRETRTDTAGQFTLYDVPVGVYTVTAYDPSTNGMLIFTVTVDENQTSTVDFPIGTFIMLPITLYDSSGYTWDIQPDGTICYGMNLFNHNARGGCSLDIISEGSTYTFPEIGVATQENSDREIVVKETDLGGINVTRKIYIPEDAYFARYLEILSNTSPTDVTVDLRITSDFYDYYISSSNPHETAAVVTTSSGDGQIQVGEGSPDLWVTVDDNRLEDPFVDHSTNIPPSAFVWAGPDAESYPDTAVLSPYDTGTSSPANLAMQWNSVTVPAGESVAIMHFVVPHASQEAARACAERLVQIPPEALSGLSLAEIAMVNNFALPADGSSSLEPLPPLTGEVTGNVLASDGVTSVESATVYFKSDNIYFSRTYVDTTYDGTFDFITDGYTGRIPVDDFTLWAQASVSSGYLYMVNPDVDSPVVSGSFAPGNTTSLDIVFSNTGILRGVVQQSTGEPVANAQVYAKTDSFWTYQYSTAADGSYFLPILLPDDYVVEVSTKSHPQGDPIETESAAVITAGQSVTLNISLPPLGAVSGIVYDHEGLPVEGALVRISDGEGFERTTNSDSEGSYTLTELPEGDYTLRAYDPDSNAPTTSSVSVTGGETTSVDVMLPYSVSLPTVLSDEKGFRWDIQADGRILYGTNNAYYYSSYGGLDLTYIRLPDNYYDDFNGYSTAMAEDQGRELTIGPHVFTGRDLEVKRKIFVPNNEADDYDDAFARYLEILENTGTSEMTVRIHIRTYLGSRGDTEIIHTSSGDQSLAVNDDYIITDDQDGTGTPTMVHVFSGPDAELEPSELESYLSSYYYRMGYDFDVTIPAGERRIVMHFASQNSNRTAAHASATALHYLQGRALTGLTPDEQADIVNFVAYPDSDCDGLIDEEENNLGTNPNNPDTDGDGLTDRFEVDYGFDPLSPGEETGNPDNDGLDNTGEQSAGTDPHNPDSDGDGISDGDEVNVYGTDPKTAVIRITDGAAPSDQADFAIDSLGNIHVVWVDDRHNDGDDNDEIYYTLLNSGGGILIDDTRLTTDGDRSRRPAIAVDTQNRAHIAWQDKRLNNTPEIFYTAIDPSRHPQDGSPGDDAVMAVVDDVLLSADDGEKGDTPRLTVDSQDRVHLVWAETDLGEIQYTRLEVDAITHAATVDISRAIFSAGSYRWYPAHSDLALDSEENVHVVWLDHRDMSAVELFYEMLDSVTGATLIDETVLTLNDGHDTQYPSISISPGDEITVVFGGYPLGTYEGSMMRINPALDDRDGSPAIASEIIVLPETSVTPDDGVASIVPTGVVDAQGNLHMTYFDDWYPAELHLLMTDSKGAAIEDMAMTPDTSAVTNGTDWTRARVASRGITSYVVWTDDRFGNAEVVLQIVSPDRDSDGLVDVAELQTGTNPDDADSDNDDLLDGFEVRNGFDPLVAGEQVQDPDGDTLNNLQEQAAGTDPNLADTDADGLDDGDELLYGADPNSADTDADGLSDGEEVHTWNSDPTLADTDGDGLADGFEAANGFDPTAQGEQDLDSDTDGLDNLAEQTYGTDPNNPDTDNDGLSDGDEVNTWYTDPLDPDTDDDGLLDGWEVAYGFSPWSAQVPGTDTDNDGLTNLEEQANGTDPRNFDTDGDGLLDGFEVLYGFNPTTAGEETLDPDGDGLDNLGEQTYGTNPGTVDFDGDMLTDGEEVLTYGSAPTVWDTDGDGLSDGEEVLTYGTDTVDTDTDGGGRTDGQEVLYDGTDPVIPGDDEVPQFFTDGSTASDQADMAIDSHANIHIAWIGGRNTSNPQVFYTMLSPTGQTLIDNTQISSSASYDPQWPSISIDSLDHVHVVWQDGQIVHECLDPYLDDRDGSAGVDSAMVLVDDYMISSAVYSSEHPLLAIDSLDRLHVVWREPSGEVGYDIVYSRYDTSGVLELAEQVIGNSDYVNVPAMDVDSQGNVHVVLTNYDQTVWSYEIFYKMIDGDDGTVLIDDTQLTPGDESYSWYPSVDIGPNDEVTIVFEDSGAGGIYMMRIDPSQDSQDGNAADIQQITVLEPTLITSDSVLAEIIPSVILDSLGNVHVSYYSCESNWDYPPADLYYFAVDPSGTAISAERPLTDQPTVATTGYFTVPPVIAESHETVYVLWTDERRGQAEVMLLVINADPDHDGLSNPEEYLSGTNPDNPDTDGDGLLDGFEVTFGFDPLGTDESASDPDGDGLNNLAEQEAGTSPWLTDTDGDGLSDLEETGTDPSLSDTDGDGLNDYDEINTYATDPNDPDMDGDGLLDGFEIVYGFDPFVADESGDDPDGDGLNNFAEQAAGTDPNNEDTDGDTLLDRFELQYGLDPLVDSGEQYEDQDMDGLDAFEEQDAGTDPFNSDTDGGGRSDYGEIVVDGTNPLDPSDDIPVPNSGDLWFQDDASGTIMCVTPGGEVTIAIDRDQITSVTGTSTAGFNNTGLVFDASGNLYFTEDDSDTILRRSYNGILTVLATEGEIAAVVGYSYPDPEDVALGSDGMLYVVENETSSILRCDPVTGDLSLFAEAQSFIDLDGITSVNLHGGLVANDDGTFYVVSCGSPCAIFEIAADGTPAVLASGSGLGSPDDYAVIGPGGDLYVTEEGNNDILRITPEGVVSIFLYESDMRALTGASYAEVEGGIAFDALGNFYVAEDTMENILRFDTGPTGTIFVPADEMTDLTGYTPNLEGGMAFVP